MRFKAPKSARMSSLVYTKLVLRKATTTDSSLAKCSKKSVKESFFVS